VVNDSRDAKIFSQIGPCTCLLAPHRRRPARGQRREQSQAGAAAFAGVEFDEEFDDDDFDEDDDEDVLGSEEVVDEEVSEPALDDSFAGDLPDDSEDFDAVSALLRLSVR
jgi:hypothetical protein